jgi:hypothetical protein
MRIKTILFLLVFHHMASGQALKNIKVIQTTKDFLTVRDSIIKLTNPTNSIAIKTCDGFREFYLTKDSLHWTGYFIKNLMIDGLPPGGFGYVKDGIKHEPSLTTLITFNADSLYYTLVSKELYDIKQISEDSIGIKYNQSVKKKDKNIIYGLPYNSLDCNMTIIVSDSRVITVTYRNALIQFNGLHCILTLKIFYNVQELLIKSFENYYH